MIIQTRRPQILLNAMASLGAFSLIGWVLEAWLGDSTSLLALFNRLTGLPIMGAVFVGIGVALAIGMIRNGMKFRIEMVEDRLKIVDDFGYHEILYSNIQSAKVGKIYGPIITLKDTDLWHASFVGADEALLRLKRASEITMRNFAGHVGYTATRLNVSSVTFINALQQKCLFETVDGNM